MITKKLILLTVTILMPLLGYARNPIIQTSFTADPAPLVYNNTVYLYTTHDMDETINNFFTMVNWRVYSSTDMVNWTDHGVVGSLESFDWIDRTTGAWAAQAIERNGQFFLYVTIHGDGVAVLVSDSPTGPFRDPLGHRLIENSENVWHDIDPTVFIDDDGQAYLYWGNPRLFYVKLNEDMISYDTSIGRYGIMSVEMTPEAFGPSEHKDVISQYNEGPWVFKRGDLYYMIYAARGIPQHLGYSTAPTATGPWTYRGNIMLRAPHLAFTNHPGIIDFKGNSYLFYHSQELSGGYGFKRSVAVEQFEYNPDGSIPLITPTHEGIRNSVANLNPFNRVEAETIAWSKGLKTESCKTAGMYVTQINSGDYLMVRSVDFSNRGRQFEASVASASTGGQIEMRLGGIDGQLLGTLEVKNTGGWQSWQTVSTKLNRIRGVHDIYLVFKGGEGQLFNFDWWRVKTERK